MTQARSALSSAVAFVVLAIVLGVCMGAWSLSRPESPLATSTDLGWATAPVVPTPSPSPIAPGPDALRIFPLGAIPSDHRLFLVGDVGDERVLLLDLAKRTVQVAAHFEGVGVAGAGRQVETTATGDGSTFVLLEEADSGSSRLLVLHPSNGALTTFVVPPSESPRVSADGRVVAVARVADPSQRGVWLVDTSTGAGTPLLADGGVAVTRPISWSGDGKHLAVVIDAHGADPRIGIVTPPSTAVDIIGAGRNARWRGNELLFWSEKPGVGVRIFDLASHGTRAAFSIAPETVILSADTRPGSIDIATVQFGGTHPSQLYTHSGETAALALPDAAFLIAFWWSRDGQHLYSWTDANGTSSVDELPAGKRVVQFCLRGAVSPPCPPR